MLDELLPPSLGEAVEHVRTVAQLRQMFDELNRRRADERRGVIELQEVSPGVFAAPRKPPPPRRTKLQRLQGVIADFDHIAREFHGRRR